MTLAVTHASLDGTRVGIRVDGDQIVALGPASEAWAVASGERAPSLGQSGRLGMGEPADFLLVR